MSSPIRPPFVSRRYFTLGLVGLAGAVCTSSTRALSVGLPLDLQARLISKVAAYDRNMTARTGSSFRATIPYVPWKAESVRAMERLKAALSGIGMIVGLHVEVTSSKFSNVENLLLELKEHRPALLCLTYGFDPYVRAIGAGLVGFDLLSASVVPAHVAEGVVLGFKAVSAKPKIVINLAQAKKENVSFRAELLKLAEVVR